MEARRSPLLTTWVPPFHVVLDHLHQLLVISLEGPDVLSTAQLQDVVRIWHTQKSRRIQFPPRITAELDNYSEDFHAELLSAGVCVMTDNWSTKRTDETRNAAYYDPQRRTQNNTFEHAIVLLPLHAHSNGAVMGSLDVRPSVRLSVTLVSTDHIRTSS